MTAELADAFFQFGPPGLIIFYLVWKETHDAKERRAEAAERRTLDLARAEADKALAGSLSALTVMIQHIGQNMK